MVGSRHTSAAVACHVLEFIKLPPEFLDGPLKIRYRVVNRRGHLLIRLAWYCFRPRWVKRMRDNTMFCGFNPAVSPAALKTMRSTIRDLGIRHRTQMTLADIARQVNPLLRGWIEYYGRYAPSALHPVLRHVNQTLLAWARRKFKRFAAHKIRASRFLQSIAKTNAALFVHWRVGMTGTFA